MAILKDLITSRKNQTVMWAASLSEKKYRDLSGAFTADGFKLFEEAVAAGAPVTHVLIALSKKEQYLPSVMQMLSGEKYAECEVFILADDCFEKVTREKSPQGIVTVLKYLDKIKNIIKINKVTDFLPMSEKTMFLCSLRDPANLGAIIRSALAFGTRVLVLSSDCADAYNPRTVRAAMGALFRIGIVYVPSLTDAVTAVRGAGRRVFAAELTDRSVSVDALGMQRGDIFVIGNEGHGISGDVSAACNGSVYLPISRESESLNAAVAASVFLWEQRD